MRRVIITKYRVYELAPDAQGVPVEKYYPDVKTWPEPMRGAKVYETPAGPVIALPDPPAPSEPPSQKPAHTNTGPSPPVRRPRRYELLSPVSGGRSRSPSGN